MNNDWHAKKEKDVLDKLKTTLNGLSAEEASNRLSKYGPNRLVEKRRISPIKIFFDQFKDIFVIMLLAAILLCSVK